MGLIFLRPIFLLHSVFRFAKVPLRHELCPEVCKPHEICPLYRIQICIVPTVVGRWQNKSEYDKYAILFDFSSLQLPTTF